MRLVLLVLYFLKNSKWWFINNCSFSAGMWLSGFNKIYAFDITENCICRQLKLEKEGICTILLCSLKRKGRFTFMVSCISYHLMPTKRDKLIITKSWEHNIFTPWISVFKLKPYDISNILTKYFDHFFCLKGHISFMCAYICVLDQMNPHRVQWNF